MSTKVQGVAYLQRSLARQHESNSGLELKSKTEHRNKRIFMFRFISFMLVLSLYSCTSHRMKQLDKAKIATSADRVIR